MLSTVSSDIFLKSKSIGLKPMVFAEWNQNLYESPYATVAGSGEKATGLTEITSLTTETGADARPNFTTKKFTMSADGNMIEYSIDLPGDSAAYKIVTFIKTSEPTPIMANIFAQGDPSQFGSSGAEISSVGWTKIETYVGGSSKTDYIPDLLYNIALNRLSTEDSFPDIFFTEPEIYPITYFSYQYNALWPTDSAFTNFRPAESYVSTGSSLFSFPADYRKVTTEILDGYVPDVYMPVSPIVNNPLFYNVSPPIPFYKDGMANDMAKYKYFVSDSVDTSITALYEGAGVMLNKLVLKFNTLMAVPTITIEIDGNLISVDGSTSIDLSLNVNKEDGGVREDAGVLVLYWTGSAWTRTRWTDMPVIGSDGDITKITTASRITVSQISNDKRLGFTYTSAYFNEDADRMQLIEASPRIEIDLTPHLIDLSINKSMDNKASLLPISAMNANDASISLSSIPLGTTGSPIPIFSNQSNNSNTVLKGILRKNIKFYTFFYLDGYHDIVNSKYVDTNNLIPAGIFYSDTWSETDVEQVVVQGYDITRYLQSTQASDYVCTLRSVIDVITNILDLSGFTDYDYDSLYEACYDKNTPIDLAYYYINSKDTTLVDALNQICLPYQIGCYIDEYGIMKFLSLGKIVNPQYISNAEVINIDESIVSDGGYSIVNKGKPGKISLRYEVPKIKDSPNASNLSSSTLSGPSFIVLSSNDIVWGQENSDSVGLNYLHTDMSESQNFFELDVNDLLDIFHTYSRDANGYAVIENEIVSFLYKQYSIEDDTNGPVYVAIKNNNELESEKGRFIKKYNTGLKLGNGTEKPEEATTIQATGKIVNVRRGLFGSKVASHKILDSTTGNDKHISHKILSSSYAITGDATLDQLTVTNNEFTPVTPSSGKVLFYPQHERSSVVTDLGPDYYKTYSVKFNLSDLAKCSGGLFFNMPSSETTANGAYFVELVKYNTYNADGTAKNPKVFGYALVFYTVSGGVPSVLAYSDATSMIYSIIANQEKVLEEVVVSGEKTYIPTSDPRYEYFNLRVCTYKPVSGDGETRYLSGSGTPNLLSVFLNNIEVTGWRIPSGSNWVPMVLNQVSGLPKKLQYSTDITYGTIFGAFLSNSPIPVPGITYQSTIPLIPPGGVREIYATHKALKERSVNYYFQDREFLNGLIQNLNIFSKSKSYMMQTKPEVVGINTYDIEYKTPAAITVDINPVQYLLKYYPGDGPAEQRYLQTKEVNEYALSYSTILNSGFRARFAIVNNTSHLVFLRLKPTKSTPTDIRLNLYTIEVISKADQETLEKITDTGNLSESISIDSKWIQSKEAAGKLMTAIALSNDNFSKDVSLNIFGNPLIQVGDIVNLTYPLMGLKDQKYFVSSISHDFNNGLGTKLGLNMLTSGTEY